MIQLAKFDIASPGTPPPVREQRTWRPAVANTDEEHLSVGKYYVDIDTSTHVGAMRWDWEVVVGCRISPTRICMRGSGFDIRTVPTLRSSAKRGSLVEWVNG